MTRVKVCGITTLDGGRAAIEHGADFLGFVFFPPSIRNLEPEVGAALVAELREACPGNWQAVGVFVNEPIARVREITDRCGLDVIQLNGEETAEYVRQLPRPVVKAVRIGGAAKDGPSPQAEDYAAERLLVDASVPGRYGGTGLTYDWAEVRPIVAGGFLAGGLTPENVGQAIAAAAPWGVDVSSGVEREGIKRPKLIAAFLEAVRAADLAKVR